MGIWARNSAGNNHDEAFDSTYPGPTLPGCQPNKGSVFSPTPFCPSLPSSAPLLPTLTPTPTCLQALLSFSGSFGLSAPSSARVCVFSHCLQGGRDCRKPSFKNEKKKIKDLKPKQNRRELDAFKGHPANNRASRDGLSSSSVPTAWKWAESSQPQLHQLKLLGAGSSSGHCAVVQTEGWCYGSSA